MFAIWRVVYSCGCVTFLVFIVFLDQITQIATQEQQLVQQKEHPATGHGMVGADLESSSSTQVRLASSFYFLSVPGGDSYFHLLPHPCIMLDN